MIGIVYSIVNSISVVGAAMALSHNTIHMTPKKVLKISFVSLIPVLNTAVCVYWIVSNPLKVKSFIREVRELFSK